MVATLPELMPEHVAEMLMAQGITPFCGLSEALMACAHAAFPVESDVDPVHLAAPATAPFCWPRETPKICSPRTGCAVPYPGVAREARKRQAQPRRSDFRWR
jgi:hypothetical protein